MKRRYARESGFTLIELMVALVLGMFVVGAALAVFRANQVSYKASEGQNRIQENARVSAEMLARDVRAAGGSACSGGSGVGGSRLRTTDTTSVQFRDMPLNGTASELGVFAASDGGYPIISATPTSVTVNPAVLPDAKNAFKANDLVIVCNARNAYLVKVESVDTTTVNFAALPQNYDLDNDRFVDASSVAISRVLGSRWYAGANTRGGSSLFVARGGPGEEAADGISNLAITYLDSKSGAYSSAPADWSAVTASRIGMTLSAKDVDGKALTRNSTLLASVRGKTQ